MVNQVIGSTTKKAISATDMEDLNKQLRYFRVERTAIVRQFRKRFNQNARNYGEDSEEIGLLSSGTARLERARAITLIDKLHALPDFNEIIFQSIRPGVTVVLVGESVVADSHRDSRHGHEASILRNRPHGFE